MENKKDWNWKRIELNMKIWKIFQLLCLVKKVEDFPYLFWEVDFHIWDDNIFQNLLKIVLNLANLNF